MLKFKTREGNELYVDPLLVAAVLVPTADQPPAEPNPPYVHLVLFGASSYAVEDQPPGTVVAEISKAKSR